MGVLQVRRHPLVSGLGVGLSAEGLGFRAWGLTQAAYSLHFSSFFWLTLSRVKGPIVRRGQQKTTIETISLRT